MTDQKIRILFITASPDKDRPIGYENEYKAIQKAIENSPNSDKIDLKFIPSVNYKDIFNAFTEYRPHIAHFAVHGSRLGNMLFEHSEKEGGTVYEKNKIELLLNNINRNVECMVLNSCFSDRAVKAINSQVNYIVSFSGFQYDLESEIFASVFYRHICDFSNFIEAYRMGIAFLGISDETPRGLPYLSGKKIPEPFRPQIGDLKDVCLNLKNVVEDRSLKIEENWAEQILYSNRVFGSSRFSNTLKWLSNNRGAHIKSILKECVRDRKPNDQLRFRNDIDLIMGYLEQALIEESCDCLQEPDFICSLKDKYPYEHALGYLCKRLPENIIDTERKEFGKMTTILLERLHFEIA